MKYIRGERINTFTTYIDIIINHSHEEFVYIIYTYTYTYIIYFPTLRNEHICYFPPIYTRKTIAPCNETECYCVCAIKQLTTVH